MFQLFLDLIIPIVLVPTIIAVAGNLIWTSELSQSVIDAKLEIIRLEQELNALKWKIDNKDDNWKYGQQ